MAGGVSARLHVRASLGFCVVGSRFFQEIRGADFALFGWGKDGLGVQMLRLVRC